MLDWKIIKNKLYFLDGSLRDIIIHDMEYDKWQDWINYISEKYYLELKNYSDDNVLRFIDPNFLKNVWEVEDVSISCYISIDLGNGVIINCYFNDKETLSQDLSPKEIRTIEDHNKLVDYLENISLLLKRDVFLTEEMNAESCLAVIKKGKLHIL